MLLGRDHADSLIIRGMAQAYDSRAPKDSANPASDTTASPRNLLVAFCRLVHQRPDRRCRVIRFFDAARNAHLYIQTMRRSPLPRSNRT
jgi:hypothetical protein